MRKILSIIFAILLACAFCGCSKTENNSAKTVQTTEKSDEQKADEQKTDEQKTDEQKTNEQNTDEQKTIEESQNKTNTAATNATKSAPKKLSGIDVSSYSGVIDWKKVSQSPVDFAMIRLGGRGYGESGALYADEKALYNIKNARKYGIKVGGYFFSQATSEKEAVEESNYALKVIGTVKLDLPIAYDFERIKDDKARTDDVTDAQIDKFASAFCANLEKNGVTAMLYGEPEDFESVFSNETKSKYASWIADYEGSPTEYTIWQYSKEGSISGISGSVDMNYAFFGE